MVLLGTFHHKFPQIPFRNTCLWFPLVSNQNYVLLIEFDYSACCLQEELKAKFIKHSRSTATYCTEVEPAALLMSELMFAKADFESSAKHLEQILSKNPSMSLSFSYVCMFCWQNDPFALWLKGFTSELHQHLLFLKEITTVLILSIAVLWHHRYYF